MGEAVSKQAILDVLNERVRQDAKWGEQNHPSVHKHAAMELRAQRAAHQKLCNDGDVERSTLAWDGILLEEVFEAVAEADEARIREELVQVAAVAVAWIECIDRRAKK